MLSELRKIIHEQNESIKRERENLNKNKNSEVEEYNNLIEKSTRGVQCQPWLRRNQWTWRQVIWNYPIRWAKNKKDKKGWRKLKGFMGHHWVERYMCYKSLRKEEIMAKKLPNLGEEIDIWIQEVHLISTRINPKKFTQRHIIIKLSKSRTKT